MKAFFTRGRLTAKSARLFRGIDAYNRKVQQNRTMGSINHKNRARRISKAFGGWVS